MWRDLTAGGGTRREEEDETEEEDVCHFEPLLLALSTAGQTGDVSFVVQGDTRVHGHACILAARSEYFRALLFGGSSESYVYSSSSGRDSATRPAIELPSLSVPTAGAVLRYLYTGALELDIGSRAEILYEVVSVANELLLPGLVRLCWRVADVHGSRIPLASFAFTSSHMAASLHAKLTSV
jgi:BTB/POZ domain-containing protein 9